MPIVLDSGIILYSLFADYELGASHKISLRIHLMLDQIGGALLAVSPWLFGFADYVWELHLIFGILEIGAALFTQRVPGIERREHHHHRTATML